MALPSFAWLAKLAMPSEGLYNGTAIIKATLPFFYNLFLKNKKYFTIHQWCEFLIKSHALRQLLYFSLKKMKPKRRID